MELFEWLKGGLEFLKSYFKETELSEWIERGLTAATIALAVMAVLLVYQEFYNCYRLLRRMYPNVRRGSRLQVMRTVLLLAITDHALFSRERRTLVRRTRILIEHELFAPRPQVDWRDGGVEPSDGWLLWRLFDDVGRRWRAWRVYRAALGEWRREVRGALRHEGDWTIEVPDPAIVNGALSEIRHYFACLRSLGFEGEEADRFICPIEIVSGFVTPLHLLTGLLIESDAKWRPILASFDRDASDRMWRTGDSIDRDTRQIQMFIYNCWLLWGPSVPICTCRNWNARYAVVQYGYGDENNSIEVVGEAREVRESLARLMTGQTDHERAIRTVGVTGPAQTHFPVMAVPANVIGRLRLSGSLRGQASTHTNALPNAAIRSWGGGQDERPVLFISEIVKSNAVEGEVEHRDARRGRIAGDNEAFPSRYYSAYLWAAIVILVPEGDRLVPLSSRRPGAPQLWTDLLPFFEHGNLADPESCLFGKRQLAMKVVSGLASIVRDWPADSAPLRFAFACAIDESGCGHDLAFPGWGGHTIAVDEADGASRIVRVRDLIAEALDLLAQTDACARRIREEGLLRFDHFSGAAGQHDYSACSFPQIIAGHYRAMARESERA